MVNLYSFRTIVVRRSRRFASFPVNFFAIVILIRVMDGEITFQRMALAAGEVAAFQSCGLVAQINRRGVVFEEL